MKRLRNFQWVLLTTLVGFVLLCLLAVLVAQQGPTPPRLSTSHLSPPLISVSFIGYSNMADGRSFAQFALSNITQSRVVVLRPSPITYTNGQWSMGVATGQPIFLNSNERKLIGVPKPIGAEAWRLLIFHGAIPSRFAVNVLRLWHVLPWKPAKFNERIESAGSVQLRSIESETRAD